MMKNHLKRDKYIANGFIDYKQLAYWWYIRGGVKNEAQL